MVIAYQHILGYFKDKASPIKKEKYLSLINKYKNGIISKNEVLDYIKNS
ncbi:MULTISPECIES: DUF1722 domain-containing protein [Anaerococcus]